MRNSFQYWIAIAFLACGCSATVNAPKDEWAQSCQNKNLLLSVTFSTSGLTYNKSGTALSCVNESTGPLVVQSGGSALVVFLEIGDPSVASEWKDILLNTNDSTVDQILPYFRGIAHNLVFHFFHDLIARYGSKYRQIYLVRSNGGDVGQKFLDTVNYASNNHAAVDLYLMVHGSASSIMTHPLDLATLSSEKIFSTFRYSAARTKLRSVFNTACQSGWSNGRDMTIAEAFKYAGDFAVTYSHNGNNYGALHKDMVAFEEY
jgi:hypothetical protein